MPALPRSVLSVLPRAFLALLAALVACIAHAEAPRQILWEDLAPAVPKSDGDDPFVHMPFEQLADLSDLGAIRNRRATGEALSAKDAKDERALVTRLQQAGIDADALLARRKEMTARRQAQSAAINAKLDGMLVRIPGYVLPLEYKEKQVSEFLLVPWVGACIHTPPPPPNQIVHVMPAKPFDTTGMFAPVWVTGKLSAASSKRSLFMLDGSADIDIAYSLKASAVEPYTE